MSDIDQLAPVYARIDAHRQAYLDRLLAYLRMPSISAEGVGIDAVAAVLVAQLQGMGFAHAPDADRRLAHGAWRAPRCAGRADGAALRPLRRAAGRPAGGMGDAAVRAGDP